MYFLPLASFYISYMEKCGDICLINRLRIFMLFAILFCSLTLTDYSSSSSSSTHWAYPVLYVDVFSSSVLISESFLPLLLKFLHHFQLFLIHFHLSLIHFSQTLSTGFLYLLKISMNSFPVIVSRWIKNCCCFVKNVHIFTNVCDCFGVSFF